MKKWTYLVAAGMLLGATPVFTGCIDNDEPEGISLLRGAKAELLKAKATVEEANAAWILASAQYQEALARHESALAQAAEYEAQKRKLEAEMMAAQNEKDKIELQKQIEKIQQDMEENALTHETTMINLKNLQAQAQRNFELVIKQIEIAKAVASDNVKVTIETLEAKVQKAYAILYGGSYTEGNTVITVNKAKALAEILYTKEEALYDASMDKAQGKGENGAEVWIPSLKLNVEKKQAELDAKNEALTTLQEFLSKDAETNDWRAEITKMEDAIKDLDKQISQKQIDLKKAQNSESYIAADQAVNGVKDEDGNVVSDGAMQVKDKAVATLNSKKEETSFNLKEYKLDVDVTDAVADILADVETSDADYNGIPTNWKELQYSAAEYKYFANGKAIDLDIEKGKYPSEIGSVIEDFTYWKKITNAATADNNAIEKAKIDLKAAQKAETDALKAYNEAKADWNIALEAYRDEKAATVPTTELKKVLDAYNTQYTALANAISAYNKAYNDAYNKAYDAEMAKQAVAYKFDQAVSAIDAIPGFNKAKAATDCSNITALNRTEAMFVAIIKDNCNAQGNETASQVQAKVMAAINAAVDTEMKKAVYTDVAKAAGDTEANKTKKDAVEAAKTKVVEAYGKIDAAIAAYNNLAKLPYGQKSTKDAAKLLKKEALAGAKATADADWAVDGAWYKLNAKTSNLEILNSNIAAEEITAATKTEIDATLAKAAWEVTSVTAFGANDRMLEPALSETTGNSKGKALFDAKANVKKQENIIASEPDLKKFKEQLEADYNALTATIQKEYAEAFSKETAAVEAAEKALEKAKLALAAEEAKFDDINVEIAKLQAQSIAQGKIKDQLIDAVKAHLGIEWPIGSTAPGNYDTKAFVKALETAVEKQKEEVAKAEKNLAEAKVDLQKAEEGKYDAVAKAERELKLAQQEYEAGAAEYETALANLQKGLEIMSKDAE